MDGIHAAKVNAWFDEHVSDAATPLEFSLITGGHSNLTFCCTDQNGRKFVLRRPPLGHILESAHDMGREHKIISSVEQTDVPVAKTHGLCKDAAVNDAPFYVMDYVEGSVLNDSLQGQDYPEADRYDLGMDIIDILARLHKVNPDDIGLGDLGRKEAYLARQVKRWVKQYEAAKTDEIVEMDEAARILQERMPEQVGSAIVHGDYRLGNMMVAGKKVQAILDWELCTLGDPLADLGYLLNNWVSPGEIEEREGDQSPTAAGGYPSRDELCAAYVEKTGRDLSEINYYRAFSHWRLASIGQGVYKRYLVGAMGDNRDHDLERQKESIVIRAQAALELLG